jgi:CheY-like chemotaxis protein
MTTSIESTRARVQRVITADPATSAKHALRVLLVEDNQEEAELIQVYLTAGRLTEERGPDFEIEWMSNLLDGMFRLQHAGIDVVLLDLGMPELTGHQSYRAIEGMTQGAIPIVILTADDRESTREMTMQFGAANYLLKQQSSPTLLRKALREAVTRFRD